MTPDSGFEQQEKQEPFDNSEKEEGEVKTGTVILLSTPRILATIQCMICCQMSHSNYVGNFFSETCLQTDVIGLG
jgi:hypothetical protein